MRDKDPWRLEVCVTLSQPGTFPNRKLSPALQADNLRGAMKIFISWSGNSRPVASALFEVLPRLFDDAEPFMSTEIRAGAIWLPELERQLSETDFGIICLTKSNSRSRWLHYEAGALSRQIGIKREVMPVMLIDIQSATDVGGPLSGFQLKEGSEAGFLDIVNGINALRAGRKIPEDILAERVSAHWGRIETAIASAVADEESPATKRDTDAMLREVLQVVRELARVSNLSSSISQIDESALSEGISSRILRKMSSRDDEENSWNRLDQAVRELANRLRSSYPPDFIVGVYPEGGFVGYLLWLDSDRKWPFILAPDADTVPLKEELGSLSAKISALCAGTPNPKGLVVDLAMKSGQTMRRTVEMVRNACTHAGIDAEIRTLCLSVKDGYVRSTVDRPFFVGLDGVDMLFAGLT